MRLTLIFPLILAVFLATPAICGVIPIIITIDEFGNGAGTVGQGFMAADPGPAGLPSVLTYNLPFAGVQGDVMLLEVTPGNPCSGGLCDYLRFNGNGTVIFYSDNIGGADSPADVSSPPVAYYLNQLMVNEIGPEGNNSATYTPSAGQPGFNPAATVQYTFISDSQGGTFNSAAPEPATNVLMGAGLLLMIGCGMRASMKARKAVRMD